VNGNPFDPRERQRRFGDPELTRRILDRTSGRACGRGEELLGARWDGALDPLDAELLAAHLETCPACRELATVLDRLQPLLPRLAERDPGPAFTARVLARTSGRRLPRTARLVTRLEGLAVALQAGLRRAWNRPRFALEAAWTAAALVSLLVWSPLAPANAGRQATALGEAGAGLMPGLNEQVEQLAADVLVASRERLGPLVVRVRSGLAEAARTLDALATAVRARVDDEPTLNDDPTTTNDEP